MRNFKILVIMLVLITITAPTITTQSHLSPAPAQAEVDSQSSQIIRVGSKAFTENRVLGWLVYHILTDMGFRVFFQTDDASTFDLRQLLATGEIDVYVEYTGTGVLHLNGEVGEELVPFDAGFDTAIAFATVSSYDSATNDLIWLPPAPANNTYALAVTEDFSEANNILTVSDFAAYANAGNPVMLAGGSEFLEREDGMAAFYRTYDFQLLDSQIMSIPNGQPQDTLPALGRGENGTNVAMAYGTASELLIGEFVLLEDDLGAQFVYNPTPVFRGEVIRNNPGILPRINPVFASLTNRQLQDMNLAVAQFGDTPEQAAYNYLIDNGFIEPADDAATQAPTVQCEVERPIGASDSANLRSEPNLSGDVLASLASGARLPVDGKRLDAEGFTWWRVTITGSPWVREDVVTEIGNCDAVPDA